MDNLQIRYLTKQEQQDPKIHSTITSLIVETFSSLQSRTFIHEDLTDPKLTSTIVKHNIHECFIAEDVQTKQILGVNFLSDRSDYLLRFVGPLGVLPKCQSKGIGKKLMEFANKQALAQGAKSIRLVQDSHNPVSFALYVKMGYKPIICVSLLKGRVKPLSEDGYECRKMRLSDLEECCELCKYAIGFDRKHELKRRIEFSSQNAYSYQDPYVITKNKKIVGFTSGLSIDGFSVVQSHLQFQILMGYVCNVIDEREEVEVMIPMVEHAELLSWCLNKGMKVWKNMNVLCYGSYTVPKTVYLPSVGG